MIEAELIQKSLTKKIWISWDSSLRTVCEPLVSVQEVTLTCGRLRMVEWSKNAQQVSIPEKLAKIFGVKEGQCKHFEITESTND